MKTNTKSAAPLAIRQGRNNPHQRSGYAGTKVDERANQLADIAASGDEDNAECCIADSFREFPPAL
jgi:hypothetical protein